MKILVYGAGNIGSLYAAKLKESGRDVSILARGQRLEDIGEYGIQLEDSVSGAQTTTHVETVEGLHSGDRYDLILVVLPKTAISGVLPILAAEGRTSNVLFLCNNAAGPGEMVEVLGRERVLLGFPGAAAVIQDHRIRYLILSAWEQPTTIGEVDGSRSPRMKVIEAVLERAGFPVAISLNIDAWLKTHVAEIVPTACALYAEGDTGRLAESPDTLRLMLQAIREGYRVLHAARIPVMPASHRLFEWLPEPVLLRLARRMASSDSAAIKIGHAERARDEMKRLADEFGHLARSTSVPTPALERLLQTLHAHG